MTTKHQVLKTSSAYQEALQLWEDLARNAEGPLGVHVEGVTGRGALEARSYLLTNEARWHLEEVSNGSAAAELSLLCAATAWFVWRCRGEGDHVRIDTPGPDGETFPALFQLEPTEQVKDYARACAELLQRVFAMPAVDLAEVDPAVFSAAGGEFVWLASDALFPPTVTATPAPAVSVRTRGGGNLEVTFAPSWLGDGFADHLVAGISQFLHALKTPDATLEDIPWELPSPVWGVAQDSAHGPLVHEQIARTAGHNPAATAIHDESGSWSYGELDSGANRLARHLRDFYSVGTDAAVALLMDNSPEALVCMLAILKSGGVYVPIGPDWPEERALQIIEQTEVTVLLTVSDRLNVELAMIPTFAFDIQFSALAESSDPPEWSVSPEDRCYVLFTSGTTGMPVGVQISHGSFANMATDQAAFIAAEAADCVLQPYSLTFDASLLCVVIALCRGAALAPVALSSLADEPLRRVFDGYGVTIASFIPSVLRSLDPDTLSGTHTLICGGEPLTVADAERYGDGRRLINSYGTTETTCCALTTEAQADQAIDGRLPVGVAITGAYVRILDGQRRQKLAGTVGDVWIGGRCLAQGYLQSPELDGTRFIDDPFLEGERLYMTGDLGRAREDGTFEIIGRRGRQAQVRGIRIEPEGIEAHLLTLPSIHAARVEVVDEPESSLVAFVAPKGDHSVETIARHLSGHFPLDATPSEIILVDQLPVTAHGKLDRPRLLSLRQNPEPPRPVEEAAPASQIEADLHALWQEFFPDGAIGSDMSFFNLGGHSLLAIRMLSRLEGRFGVEIPFGRFLAQPTIAFLASQVESLSGTARAEDRSATGDAPEGTPLTPSQTAFWLLDQVSETGYENHVPRAFLTSAPLDIDKLRRAFERVAHRHDVFRTSFIAINGTPQAKIQATPKDAFRHDSWPANESAETLIAEETRRRFDLQNDPLIRLRCWQNENRALLVITAHHIVCDGWSIGLLLRDLATAFDQPEDQELPPLQTSLSQCLRDLATEESSAEGARRLNDWVDRIGEASQIAVISPDHPRPRRRTIASRTVGHRFSPEERDRVRDFGASRGHSPFIILAATLARLLGEQDKAEAVRFGVPTYGRPSSAFQEHIGCFLNMLAIQVPISGRDSFNQLVEKVAQSVRWGIDRARTPFHAIAERLPASAEPGRHPAFDIELDYRSGESESDPKQWRLGSLTAKRVADGRPSAGKFDMDFLLTDDGHALRLDLHYNTTLYKDATAAKLANRFQELLFDSIERPDQPMDTPCGEGSSAPPTPRRAADRARARLLAKLAPARTENERSTFQPLERSPAEPNESLVERLRTDCRGGALERDLGSHGAIVYRGFDVEGIEGFQQALAAMDEPLFNYMERSSPRKDLSPGVYTATEHPSDQTIKLHCEHSYSHEWPARLTFFGLQPASSGGATTLSETRPALESLPEYARSRFQEQGVLYVRAFGGLGLHWEEVFQTDSQAEIEAYCQANGIECEWLAGGRLRTRSRRPAIRRHPITGEPTWFNHAYFFHPQSIEPELRRSLLTHCSEDELPFQTFYGDGGVIEDEVIRGIGKALESHKTRHPWRRGDLVILDNMLVAHGRESFTGPRKILLAMSKMCRDTNDALPAVSP